jgi:hypothetical protein
VRVPDISEEDLEATWVGTEENTRLRTTTRNAFGETPFTGGGEAAPPVAPGERPAGAPGSEKTPAGQTPPGKTPPPGQPTKEGVEPVEEEEEFEEEFEEDEEEEPEPGEDVPPPGGTKGEQDAADQQAPTSIAQVILVAPRSSYRVGETVTIQAQIVGAQNVGSVPFHMRFNAQVFTFVPPAVEGDFLASDGASTVFVASEVQGAGEVVVGLSRVGSQTGATGSGLLATFQFLARAPGSGSFSFTGASVRSPAAASLPSSFSVANVNVTGG